MSSKPKCECTLLLLILCPDHYFFDKHVVNVDDSAQVYRTCTTENVTKALTENRRALPPLQPKTCELCCDAVNRLERRQVI